MSKKRKRMTLKERDKQAETETHRRTETQRDKNMVLNLLRNYHRDKSIQTQETLRQGGDSLGSSTPQGVVVKRKIETQTEISNLN